MPVSLWTAWPWLKDVVHMISSSLFHKKETYVVQLRWTFLLDWHFQFLIKENWRQPVKKKKKKNRIYRLSSQLNWIYNYEIWPLCAETQ
jgi:hypothetical protein